MDTSYSLDQLEKHPELWWEDGNVVLVAKKKGFKAHRSVLSRKSAIFNDMFAVSGQSPQNTFECIPVVHLADDPEELAYFLDAMYNGLNYRSQTHHTLPWKAIRAMLVLGDKYGVDELRQEGVRIVQAAYPKNIKDWDNRYQEDGNHPDRLGPGNGAALIDLVNIAGTLHLDDVRIAALYDCCSLSPKVLVNGAESTGSSTCVKLGPTDLAAVLDARTGLNDVCMSMVTAVAVIFDDNEDCKMHCTDNHSRLVYRWALDSLETSYNPLSPVENTFSYFAQDCDFCDSCIEYYKAQYTAHRQMIRDILARWMGLD